MGLIEEIFSGWKNYTFQTPEIEEMAKERVKKCVSCKIKDGTVPGMRSNKTCKVCGCYVPAKVRSKNSHCPLKKW